METAAVSELESVKPPISWIIAVPAAVVGLGIIFMVGFELMYAGRVMPGVMADGIYVGGLTQADAVVAVTKGTEVYAGQSLSLRSNVAGAKITTIPVAKLGVTYDAAKVAAEAAKFGHSGSLFEQAHAQLRALFGRTTPLGTVTFDDAKLAAASALLVESQSTPVSNAALSAGGGQVTVVPSRSGSRLDLGEFVARVQSRLAATSTDPIDLPSYEVAPTVDTAGLVTVKAEADQYLVAPLTLTYVGSTKTIDQSTIAEWLKVTSQPAPISVIATYPLPPKVTIDLDPAAVTAFVSKLGTTIDQAPRNAVLTVVNGQPVAAEPGADGRKLDQAAAVTAISKALDQPADQRTLALNVAVVKPEVGADTLANMGITELLSEGISFFTGSDANRRTNIRVGSSRFNGVLLKPGEEFSFNRILGDVGPEFGYAPGYVILGNHEEKQYGGGLCQVSSTAYRAALLAGLPITARTNHSFAVSWYTAPFGTPGVDATIYLPSPDMKFVNDTGHYILVQTIMSGNTLKFDFYGTKTKVGQIRGPFFVTGSMDDTKPSQTVFYRDILDLAGTVTHTDTVTTNYQSSSLFPIAAATGN